eukprot:gene17808-24186_t
MEKACTGQAPLNLQSQADLLPWAYCLGVPAMDSPGDIEAASKGVKKRYRMASSLLLSDWCMSNKWSTKYGSMLGVEFEHWLKEDFHTLPTTPSAANTVLSLGDQEEGAGGPTSSPADFILLAWHPSSLVLIALVL